MRVLAIDIETTPNLVYTWGLWDQNVGLSQVVETSGVMCFAAKWLGQRRMTFRSTHHHGREEMVREAHRLLDEADVVLHYNGTRFDIPHLNREFVEAGLGPPSPFDNIDLLATARRWFKFQSNKLQHVSRQLGLEGKVAHEGFDLWTKCMADDPKAWRRMERYNRQDVKLLEDLYEILLPWIPRPPNRLLTDGVACPRCGGDNLQRRGQRVLATGVYQQYQCLDCGGFCRTTKRMAGAAKVAI